MTVTYDFTGKTAFVTGGSAGMGAATVRAFAEAGARVAVVDLDGDAARQLSDDLTSRGFEALAVRCDVSDEDQVEAAVRATVEKFGSLDMAFNNAGIMLPPIDSADETAEAFDKIVSVNLRGVWATMKHELVQMRTQGSGVIVNCSSLGGLVGGEGRATYHATKHGVIGATKSVALQYGRHGVRVNAVCPGTISTPMVEKMIAGRELDPDAAAAGVPLGRLGRPEEIAAAVLWLSSDASSYVTGVALPVDAGYTAQ
ncbi:3-oxoacyl-ACP reductase [Rhodococcus sp. 15-725-2-2b]|jgi:NAD(P)-dependent dehydrogenase (short-subunit alcohol dehydrogenase family)|uniref:SDR family NAD(P)-dependent oxidoreductase n=1 Tax=Nocardiaceae TaxID=85025 RepID=UPI00056AB887|nr:MULTISPECIES: glucose 1-dehydrogenase [Rhodococcus]OZC61881.1 3-oxoacyl-ACP reductase [Rhodococcus sp. 06-470-2]OZC64621.1 3-oxoacyl-ACP reductase [Rhodococcus sp. 06-469-3-2]OZC93015.1 3-oxoacyl-ACP reductase [Rhodococcus sp. 06-418-1B]OZD43439.1 3-oxoacyl-ACP reductase [Rhodococcus sp. 06-1477-1A]OZE26727.1 3-oxoacyl-ACP reductase [Rhodococcus sp. 05-2254-5]